MQIRPVIQLIYSSWENILNNNKSRNQSLNNESNIFKSIISKYKSWGKRESLKVKYQAIIFSWNHTSYVHRTSLFWHSPDWRFWDNHPDLSPAVYTLCSSMHQISPVLRRQHTSPEMTHSCIHHKPAQACKDALKNHRLHTFHHISHKVVQWQYLVVSGTWSNQDGAWPCFNQHAA